jgi:chromosome segregation ATPase|tara:strand:+ start:2641 stop:2934 length:294 start_codon:yes stop_codon:yes gene_type:complete
VPRSPAPERVNRALTERINYLKEEVKDLKSNNATLEGEREDLTIRMTKQAREFNALSSESEQMRKDLSLVLAKVTSLESEIGGLRGRLDRCEKKAKG